MTLDILHPITVAVYCTVAAAFLPFVLPAFWKKESMKESESQEVFAHCLLATSFIVLITGIWEEPVWAIVIFLVFGIASGLSSDAVEALEEEEGELDKEEAC